MTTIVVLGSC